MKEKEQHIIFFDGVCNLCNSSVQFIIKRDKKARFKFITLQSEKARELLMPFENPEDDSVLYLKNGKLYKGSSAALQICRKLNGLWPVLFIFILIPAFIRDAVYNWIARNRYRWFGKLDECMVPTEALRDRFLDV